MAGSFQIINQCHEGQMHWSENTAQPGNREKKRGKKESSLSSCWGGAWPKKV